MRIVLRVLAILLALFILAGSLGDLFGMVGHSHVGILARIHRSFIPLVTAVLLLVPAKSLKSGVQALVYLIALFAVNCWYSLIWMRSIAIIFHGTMNPKVIAIGLLMMAILWGTFWVAANQYFTASPKKRGA
ncbi:MAG: hypothetical protein ACXVZX_14945 [Terriglobales bacterium]